MSVVTIVPEKIIILPEEILGPDPKSTSLRLIYGVQVQDLYFRRHSCLDGP